MNMSVECVKLQDTITRQGKEEIKIHSYKIYDTIVTKYLPPTNTKPARIKATDYLGRKIITSFKYYNMNAEEHVRAAEELTEKYNIKGKMIMCESSDINPSGYVFAIID